MYIQLILTSDLRLDLGCSQAGVATAGPVHRGEIVDEMRDYRIVDDVIGAINRQITEDTYSRLFAVVFINGKQFKVCRHISFWHRCGLI